MAQFGSIITNIGLAKIANAQITHDTVDIESMVLGDGNGAYYTVSQNQTALRNEVWRGLLSDQRIDPSNPNRIEFSAFITSTVGGFTIREVGLLDTDGNLIALSLYPEQYKPTLGEGISDDILIHFVIETSNASVITLAVDVTNVIATRQYVDKKTAEVNNVLATHLDDAVTDSDGAHGLKIEEGVWTPVLKATVKQGTHTYNTQLGKFIKTNRSIWISFMIILDAFDTSASGDLFIDGLPFVVSEITTSCALGLVNVNKSPTDNEIRAVCEGVSIPLFATQIGANGYFRLTKNHLLNNLVIYGTATYKTN